MVQRFRGLKSGKLSDIFRWICRQLRLLNCQDLIGIRFNRYLTLIRQLIAQSCERESPFQGEVEVDESFFGARRVRGKRWRGALGKTIVFGVYKRNGKVYTEIVPDCSRSTLHAVIRGKVDFKNTIHSNKWRAYDGLVDLGYRRHYRVNHGANVFATDKTHINGI